jgi:hypothetical protein
VETQRSAATATSTPTAIQQGMLLVKFFFLIVFFGSGQVLSVKFGGPVNDAAVREIHSLDRDKLTC